MSSTTDPKINPKHQDHQPKSSTVEADYIQKLPNELKLQVTRYLPVKDMSSFHGSCQAMHNILHNQFLLVHRTIHISLTRPSLDKLKRLAAHPLRTEVQEIGIIVNKYDKMGIHEHDRDHPTITAFEESGMGGAMLAVALHGFPNCVKISLIYDVPLITRFDDLPICLTRSTLSRIIGTPVALRKAIISVLTAIAAGGPPVTHLTCTMIKYTSQSEEPTMEKMLSCAGPGLACLQKLDIKLLADHVSSSNMVRSLFERVPNLQSLSFHVERLSSTEPVPERSSLQVGVSPWGVNERSCPQLESLAVSSNLNNLNNSKVRLDEEAMVRFLSGRVKSLKKIHLSGVTFETFTGFLKVLDCMKTHLHLNDIKFHDIALIHSPGYMWQFLNKTTSLLEFRSHLKGDECQLLLPSTKAAWMIVKHPAVPAYYQPWPAWLQSAIASSLSSDRVAENLDAYLRSHFQYVTSMWGPN